MTMDSQDLTFDFVECRPDGSIAGKETGNVKLRQWTKASPRMASQVRDSEQSSWRNAEVALRVRYTPPAFASEASLFVCIYRHWSPCVERRGAQQRVLVKINKDGTFDTHESIAKSDRDVTTQIDERTNTTTMIVPLVPFSFKLPVSTTLIDEWKGQARNVSVFFTVRAPSSYLRVLPSTKDSLSVEQYPKRISSASSSSGKPSSPEAGEVIDFPAHAMIPIHFQHEVPASYQPHPHHHSHHPSAAFKRSGSDTLVIPDEPLSPATKAHRMFTAELLESFPLNTAYMDSMYGPGFGNFAYSVPAKPDDCMLVPSAAVGAVQDASMHAAPHMISYDHMQHLMMQNAMANHHHHQMAAYHSL